MKLSMYIDCLKVILDEHGDLDVETTGLNGCRRDARYPEVNHRAILKGRESAPRFASEFQYIDKDPESRKGGKVCRV